MARLSYFTLFIVLCFSAIGRGRIINIPADYPTIQQGLNASVNGDTVLVQPGTYTGNGNRDLDFWSKSVHLKSAAGPDDTIIDCHGYFGNPHRGFIFQMNEDSTSIIEGFTITEGFQHSRGAGIYCFNGSPKIINCHFMYNETDGFGGAIYSEAYNPIVIRQCTFDENYAFNRGGGLYFDNSHVILSECTITMNSSNNNGGGIYFISSRGSIIDCLIRDNSAMNGGGITCANSDSLFFNDCVIQRNDVTVWSGWGGGLYCGNSSPIFTGCTFIENTSSDGGAVFCIAGSDPTFIDCIFQFNSAVWGSGGGGIYAFGCTTLTLINCVIGRNSAPECYGGGLLFGLSNIIIINTIVNDNNANKGGGISTLGSEIELYNSAIIRNTVTGYNCMGGGIYSEYSSCDLTNCIVWDNYASNIPDGIYADTSSNVLINYSDIQGGWQGPGNINAEPLFRDSNHGDFHLMSLACGDSTDSPCIDAGDPSILDSLLDCSWGLGGSRSDMGAYGGGDSAQVGIIADNSSYLPKGLVLSQNYPNPFNSQTTISYVLDRDRYISLTIYDVLGRIVTVLENGQRYAGNNSVTWNANKVPTGVYFLKADFAERSVTIKMLLLK